MNWDAFDSWPKFLAVDPASAKPFAMLWGTITPRNDMVVFNEWPEEHFWDCYAPDWGTEGYASLIDAIEGGQNFHGRPLRNVIWRVMDPNYGRVKNPSSGKTLPMEFNEFGLWFDTNVQDDFTSGTLAVRERLDAGTLYITPNCHNLLHSIKRFTYAEVRDNPLGLIRKEAAKQEYSDFPDALRYACKMGWFYVDLSRQGRMMTRTVPNGGLGRASGSRPVLREGGA